jgi:hypothetical protein
MTTAPSLPIREQDFTNAVIQLAQYRGWLVAHFRPGRTVKGWRTPVQGHRGYPDLTMSRAGRLIFAELKTQKGKTTPEQDLWITALQASNAEVYVWRPRDLRESIPDILR